ncbi:MAG: M23 family metallopeptidase [Rhodospirillaceae bacterium]|nr:M23 family metallopeptidase [Rhodospirillaceae bacterium]
MRCLCALAVLVSFGAVADEIALTGRIEQGGVAVGTAPPGAKVTFDGRDIALTDSGTFVLGFDRDAKAQAVLEIALPNGATDSRTLTVNPREWRVERVDGLAQKLVTPDPETAARIAEDNKLMAAVRARTEAVAFFETGFIRPAEGRVSGVFGSQRILNGVPRAPHLGLDIAGPIGTPVRAAADGIVSLAKADMVLTGQSVVIEHGYGLDTVYIHMNAIRVADGQRVKQGDVIGEIGQSGRANGPHLHFGVTWFDTRLDPETVLAVLPSKNLSNTPQ